MSTIKRDLLIRLTYYTLLLSALYFTSYLLLGAPMLPDGAGWALILLYICSTIAGKLLPLVAKRLPPLLAMLAVGLLLRNLPGGPLDTATAPLFFGNTFSWWSRWLRAAALAVIMLRAGLGLDLDKLRKLGLATARLAFLPCLCEALTVLAISYPLLGLPPAWGGTLGFVLAAVSPAVVVPGMLDLGQRGYGTAKGVPTMVVAAASFDDVLAIAGFGVCLALAAASEASGGGGGGVISSNSSLSSNATGAAVSEDVPLAWLILKAPTELITGIAFGWVYGAIATAPSSQHALFYKGEWMGHLSPEGLGSSTHFKAVLVGALLSVVGGKSINFSGGGALGAIVLGATAGRLWPDAVKKEVQAHVNDMWALLQPALFGLLGAAVNIQSIDPQQLGSGLAVIAIALTLRTIVTRLALIKSGLSDLEARLVCVAWLPKATVQAAVGGTALDLMEERGYGPEAEARGRLVLMLSVLVILLTAPVGALGISILGPKWLTLDEDPNKKKDKKEEEEAEAVDGSAQNGEEASDGKTTEGTV